MNLLDIDGQIVRLANNYKGAIENIAKIAAGITIPVKTRTITTTHYMTVSRDNDKNISFQSYDNEDAYKQATSNW